MSNTRLAEIVHYVIRPLGEPYACGLLGYPNGPTVHNTNDPEMVHGCVICEAEATAQIASSEKNLVAIYMDCQCELTNYAPKESPGVVMVPHSCINHGGYHIGEHPSKQQYTVIIAEDDEVRKIWQATINDIELGT